MNLQTLFPRLLPFLAALLLSLALANPVALTVLGSFDSLLLWGSARLRYTWDSQTNALFIAEAALGQGVTLPEGVLAEERPDGLLVRFAEPYTVTISPDERRLQVVRTAFLRANPAGSNQANLLKEQDERLPQMYRLTYANPATVAGQLGQLYGNIRVVVDERQHALLVLMNPADKPLIDQVVKLLDTPRPQVAFEAEVVEINRSLSQSLGIDYDLSLFRFGLRETNIPQGGLRLGTFGRDGQLSLGISATLNLLQTTGAGKVLARPRVVTTDGIEARINATQNLAIIVINNNVQSVQNVSTGITLKMLPRVGTDGSIEVQVTISVSAPTSQTQSTFTFSNRDASTLVRVMSGESIVIGGLFESRKTESVEKVPGLADIPVIGELFKNTSTTTSDTDLVIVITPRLLTGVGEGLK